MTQSIIDRVMESCDIYEDRWAIVAGAQEWTYRELGQEINRAADALSGHLDRKIDRVGIFAPNSASYIAAYYGALQAGYVPFLMDPALGRRDIEAVSRSCGLVAILHPAALSKELPDTTQLGTDVIGALGLSVLKAQPGDLPRLDPETGTCRFTSGTTGTPKCLEFSHRAVILAAENWCVGTGMAGDENTLCLATFANGLAFNTSLLATLISGAKLTLYDGMLNSARVGKVIQAGAITRLAAFPLVYKILVDAANVEASAFSSLRIAASAGAPLALEMQAAFEDRYGKPLANYYGIAEVGPCTFHRPDAADGLGAALPGVDLRCSGTDTAPGDILVKTASMATRYLNAPGMLEERTTDDGFYRSGDLGHLQDQCLFVVGRLDQLINLAGRKIDPQEIETFALTIPDVADAVAFADRTATGDTFIHLAVVGPTGLDLGSIIRTCRSALTSYKVPSKISHVDAIPRSSSGKMRVGALLAKIQMHSNLENVG